MYQRGLLLLKFEDPTLEGLKVYCKRLNVGQTLALTSIDPFEVARHNDDGTFGEIPTLIASKIVKWNLHDEEQPPQPVPVSVDNLMEQDLGLFTGIMMGLIEGSVPRVTPPLPRRSPNGAPSLAESIVMEPLSPNQPSVSEPG